MADCTPAPEPPAGCVLVSSHGNPFRYCPACSWMEEPAREPQPQSARECAEIAVALARAAEMDEALIEDLWRALDPEKQEAVVYVLALWVAQLRAASRVPWEAVIDAVQTLGDGK